MKAIRIFSAIIVLAGTVAAGAAAAQQINLNLNQPSQQFRLPNAPNYRNQQQRENFQLQQQFNREIDRSNTMNSRNQPNVPIIVPNCRPMVGGSLAGQSCR